MNPSFIIPKAWGNPPLLGFTVYPVLMLAFAQVPG
jgi:hypothetical protein